MSEPLFSPLDPFADESLTGFVARTVGEHGFNNPIRFLHGLHLGITRIGALAKGAYDVDQLAEFLGLRQEEMSRLRYKDDNGQCRVLGHEISADFVMTGRRRVCPRCLEEAPYHRAVWDIAPMTACAIHGVMLLDRCPGCSKRLHWTYGSAVHCGNRRCVDGDLSTHDAPSVPASEMAGIVAVDSLFHHGIPFQDGPLAGLAVGQLLRLVFDLGCIATRTRLLVRPREAAERDPARMPQLLVEGWAACQSWPSGLHRILKRLQLDAKKRPGRYGIRKHFGGLPGWAWRVQDEPYGALLTETLVDFAAAVPGFASRMRAVRRRQEAKDVDRPLSIAESAKRLGVASTRLRNVAQEGGLFILEPSGKGAPALLSEQVVQSLETDLAGHLIKAEAKRMLGVGRHAMDDLIQGELLCPVEGPELRENARFLRADVEGLIQSVAAHVSQLRARRPKGAITLMSGVQRLGAVGVRLDELVAAAMQGQLVPAFVEPRRLGLARYLYAFADIRALVDGMPRPPKATMSIDEAAKRLGVKQEVAYHWARRGILATVRASATREAGARVTEEALQAFRAEYVAGTEVAKQAGLRARWVVVHLEKRGVRPVSGPSVDDGRQALFKRSDVADVRVGSLVSGASKLVDKPSTSSIRAAGAAVADRIIRVAEGRFGTVVRRRHRMVEMASGVLLVVMVAKNSGLLGTYHYVLTPEAKAKIEQAREAWIVLGFLDRSQALLVSWPSLAPEMAAEKRHWAIRADIELDGTVVLTPGCSGETVAV